MAFYSSTNAVQKSTATDKFTRLRPVGSKPTFPGIYECQRCGFEDVINRECETLPPCSKCREDSRHWKLIVRAMDADDKPNGPQG